MLATIGYNLIMAAMDAWALFSVGRTRTTTAWLTACGRSGLAALVLAVVLALTFEDRRFGAFGLVAYGLFLHGTLVLGFSVPLLWRARPKTAATSGALGAIIALTAVDAFWIEPTWLEVSHVRMATPKVTRPVRIVVIADLQTDRFGSYEREVFRRAMQQEPDLILLAGDYLQAEPQRREELNAQFNAFLRRLGFSAPQGAFAVEGNVDAPGWTAMFDRLPVTAVHRTESFDLPELRLTCLSERDSFNPSLEVPAGEPGRFHVVLGHSPRYALGQVEADLMIAGHTHGGQVCLPLIDSLVMPTGHSRRWTSGLSDLAGGRKLFISRGIGMERGPAPRLRFLCRPELAVIDLVPR